MILKDVLLFPGGYFSLELGVRLLGSNPVPSWETVSKLLHLSVPRFPLP